MPTRVAAWSALGALLAASSGQAVEDPASADDLMNRAPWQSCTYCHGIDGGIDDAQVPSIGGQSPGYLRKQLDDFRSGHRVDPSGMMRSALFLLEPGQVDEVVRYFADQAPVSRPTALPTETPAEAGGQLVRQGSDGVPPCASCHDRGRAEHPTVPRLRGQNAGYLARQAGEIERRRRHEHTGIPADVDYGEVKGLSAELREKLAAARPDTIGRASRIPGMTPAAISLLLVHLKKRSGARRVA